MRIFIAIPVDENLVRDISETQENFAELGNDIKMVEKDNFHFTVKFIGDVPEEKLEKIKRILDDAAEKFHKFEIRVAGGGCFPSKNYIKIIWLGVKDGYQEMYALMRYVDEELVKLGFDREDNKPHMTLGRVRTGRKKQELLKAIENLENAEIGKMVVKEITIFDSELSTQGPVYKKLYSVKLL